MDTTVSEEYNSWTVLALFNILMPYNFCFGWITPVSQTLECFILHDFSIKIWRPPQGRLWIQTDLIWNPPLPPPVLLPWCMSFLVTVSGVFSTGVTGVMPPGAQKNWNFTIFWRKKWVVCDIMNDIRNWSPLAAMKLFTTRKYNTVEWPKMHNLQNGKYKFFRGIHPASLYLFHGA